MRETVLITGASAGIGFELARLFAADGSDVIIVARRVDRLNKLAEELRNRFKANVRAVPADLTQEEARARLFDDLQRDGLQVDVLVNNAGFGAHGAVTNLPVDRQLEMIELNVSALVHLTCLFLPGMKERGRGGILNVGSTAAFQPGPFMAVYYATKAFVLHFTEALATELRGTRIAVTCLAPGPTHTEFASKAEVERTRLFSSGVMDAQSVARAGYRGFRRNKAIVIPGLKNKVLAFSVRLAPRAFTRRIVEMMNS